MNGYRFWLLENVFGQLRLNCEKQNNNKLDMSHENWYNDGKQTLNEPKEINCFWRQLKSENKNQLSFVHWRNKFSLLLWRRRRSLPFASLLSLFHSPQWRLHAVYRSISKRNVGRRKETRKRKWNWKLIILLNASDNWIDYLRINRLILCFALLINTERLLLGYWEHEMSKQRDEEERRNI